MHFNYNEVLLLYWSGGRWFDPSWCQWIFFREYFLGVKSGRGIRLTTYHHPVPLSRNLGALNSWNPLGLSRPVMGLLYLYLFTTNWICFPKLGNTNWIFLPRSQFHDMYGSVDGEVIRFWPALQKKKFTQNLSTPFYACIYSDVHVYC